MLDFKLSPQQQKLQKKAREFALKEILPVAWYYDEIDETPLPVLRKAYDAGLINGDIPKKYGGEGWGLIESVVITEEFAAACPGLAWPPRFLIIPSAWNRWRCQKMRL
jgi:acyl-CoA dehydrogenase